jgi:RNA polymerase sigma factor (sigma-70 family)
VGTPSGREVDVIDLDRALTELAELDPRRARVVELRYFGGLTVPEVADHLGLSPRTVELDWRGARAWLAARLDRGGEA